MFALRLLPRSLVGRVFALYTVTLLVFVALGLAVFYRYQFGVELEDAQQRTEALSMVITPTVSDSAVIGDYDTIRRTLERAVHQSALSSASFIDLQGGIIRASFDEAPTIAPPSWLLALVASKLYDVNQTLAVGGRDYGVLRLSFAPDRIAGRLWEQILIALALALASIAGGLALIRFPLVRWLGNLGRIQAYEQAMLSGEAVPSMLAADETPIEFRKTFEVLGRAAESLQSQRVQAAVTLGAIADGVFTLDRDGQVILANPAACDMAGKPMQELLGRPVSSILPQLVVHGSRLSPWTTRRVTMMRPDERHVVVDTTLSSISASDGSASGFVLACRDISQQYELDQRLQAELRMRESALVALRNVLEGLVADSATTSLVTGADDLEAISVLISGLVAQLQMRGEQLNAIFALSPDGFVSFDSSRRANYVSPAFERLTDISASSVLGQQEHEIENLLRLQCNPSQPWRGFEAIRQDALPLDLHAQPHRERIELVRPVKRILEVGLVQGTTEAISQVLSLRDVTHESEIDSMKSEFLSTAAHELRTPMTSIYGFAQLIAHRQLSPERQRDIIATIYRQTERMIAILNELLDLARIEARRGKDFVFETVDLSVLTEELLRDFKPPQSRDAPAFHAAAHPVQVSVDRNKLAQAIGNILSNAYKYSPQGGVVEVHIVAQGAPEGGLVGLEVTDHGIGLTAEQLERVSERFYRADASGNIPGTGLGMSIVKEIVELHGGRLALASEFGQGTRVTLWLPRASLPQPVALTAARTVATP